MRGTLIIYACILALAAFLLDWLDYRHLTRSLSSETYIVLIAIGFTALGIWGGYHLTNKKRGAAFEKNEAAIAALKISPRELDVLELVAEGQSNKEIARSLDISPNTVKTHMAKLFEKLEVSRRTQALQKARSLHLIP